MTDSSNVKLRSTPFRFILSEVLDILRERMERLEKPE